MHYYKVLVFYFHGIKGIWVLNVNNVPKLSYISVDYRAISTSTSEPWGR